MNSHNNSIASDQGFKSWLNKVDKACEKLCGLSIHDLPDCPFKDWYNDGVKPIAAAKRVIRNAE